MQFSGVVFAPILYNLFPITKVEAVSYWSIISFILGVIIVLLLMKPDIKEGLHQRDRVSKTQLILWTILGVFMAFFAQFLANFIQIMVFGIKPGSENTQAIMNITRATPLFMIIPIFAAPILEEVIFRKIIFGTLYKRTNFLIAAILSAVIFGFIHGEPQHILVYGSMGIVFAYLYIETKRIIVPIIAHMTMNAFVVISQYNMDPAEIERQLNKLQTILHL